MATLILATVASLPAQLSVAAVRLHTLGKRPDEAIMILFPIYGLWFFVWLLIANPKTVAAEEKQPPATAEPVRVTADQLTNRARPPTRERHIDRPSAAEWLRVARSQLTNRARPATNLRNW